MENIKQIDEVKKNDKTKRDMIILAILLLSLIAFALIVRFYK